MTESATNRIRPVVDDYETSGFFRAAARGALGILFCAHCNEVLHLPVPYCSKCGSSESSWRDVSPTGAAYTWTVVEHQVHPAYPTPYTVVLVELDCLPGVRLVGSMPGRANLAVGTRMIASFVDIGDGVSIPEWTVDSTAG